MSAPGDVPRENNSSDNAIPMISTEPPQVPTGMGDPQPSTAVEATPARIASTPTVDDEPASWRQKSLLTFDGGGIRGYASLLLLEELMIHIGRIEHTYSVVHATSYGPCEKPKGLSHQYTGLQAGAYATEYFPCHYFDYIAGTSTGGLIATMLSRWRMPVTECLPKYSTFGRDIFRNKRKISAFGFPQTKHSKKPLVQAIKTLTEQKSPQAQPDLPIRPEFEMFPSPDDLCRTIVVAIRKGQTTLSPDEPISRSRASDGPYLFRSYKPDPQTFNVQLPPQHYDVDINHEIWKVCRATTAATTYFEPQVIGDARFCDGGAGVNNPTLKAYNEMTSLHENDVKIIASFGTGKHEPSSLLSTGRAHRLNPFAATSNLMRSLKTLKAVLTECEETHEHVENTAFVLRNGDGAFNYFRFNVAGDLGKVKMNEWKDRRDDGKGGIGTTLDYIRTCTNQELMKPLTQQRLAELARMLVARRRERARDDPDRWERFSCCTRYKCLDDGCRVEGELQCFALRREMRAHLDRVHHVPPDLMEARLERCLELPSVPAGPL